jgi:hypothetical protein
VPLEDDKGNERVGDQVPSMEIPFPGLPIVPLSTRGASICLSPLVYVSYSAACRLSPSVCRIFGVFSRDVFLGSTPVCTCLSLPVSVFPVFLRCLFHSPSYSPRSTLGSRG